MTVAATAAWRPDVAALKSKYAADIRNILYGEGVMIPVPALMAFSEAVAEQPLGGITARKDGLVHIFVGTATKLWKYDNTTNDWNDVSQAATTYTASTDQRWRFKKFGDYIVTVNINDAPQYFELGVSATFTDLPGSPPNARQLAVWGDHLALFAEDTVSWSDTNDIGNWSTGNAGSQTFPDGGDIQGSFDATNPLLVQREAIRQVTFMPGSLDVFAFTKISDKRGAISPYAVGTRGEFLFFADTSAFYQLSAAGEVIPVGFEKVDRYSFGLIGGNDPGSVYCEVDPVRPRVYFAVKSNTESDAFDRLLVYDWQIGEWSKIETTLGILFPLAAGTIGQDLDTDVPGDPDDEFLDTDAPSLDSSIYESGAPLMAAFDTDFRLGFFNGANAEAYIETAEMGEITGQMRRVTELYPVVDASDLSQIHVSIGARNRRSDTFTWSSEFAPSTNTGIARKNSRARFQKYRLRIDAGADWSFLQGINDNAVGAGFR